jgi:hypothetical protein
MKASRAGSGPALCELSGGNRPNSPMSAGKELDAETALQSRDAPDGGASVRAWWFSAGRCRRRLSDGGWLRRGGFCRCSRAGR